MMRSTKLPAEIVTLPVTEQDAPFATAEQTNAVLAMLAGAAPERRVTVMGPSCSEKTLSPEAVQAVGTQVSAENAAAVIPDSVELEFGLLTE
jgi:hypothetical protein